MKAAGSATRPVINDLGEVPDVRRPEMQHLIRRHRLAQLSTPCAADAMFIGQRPRRTIHLCPAILTVDPDRRIKSSDHLLSLGNHILISACRPHDGAPVHNVIAGVRHNSMDAAARNEARISAAV